MDLLKISVVGFQVGDIVRQQNNLRWSIPSSANAVAVRSESTICLADGVTGIIQQSMSSVVDAKESNFAIIALALDAPTSTTKFSSSALLYWFQRQAVELVGADLNVRCSIACICIFNRNTCRTNKGVNICLVNVVFPVLPERLMMTVFIWFFPFELTELFFEKSRLDFFFSFRNHIFYWELRFWIFSSASSLWGLFLCGVLSPFTVGLNLYWFSQWSLSWFARNCWAQDC